MKFFLSKVCRFLALPIITLFCNSLLYAQEKAVNTQIEGLNIVGWLKEAIATDSSAWFILVLAFLAGVIISFTPCVYPMIPITIGILQSQAQNSVLRNFLAACSYVLGIALVYATLGYIAATTSIIFGQWLGNPWFIALVVAFFLYLAFSLFGFYDIYLPSFLTQRSQINAGKSLFHTFIFGMLAGTVASPCLTPALAVLLGFAAQQNPITGFLMLFAFSLGMGLLLVLAGTFASTMTLLPQAGVWMGDFKKAFGFIVLAVCVYFLDPLLDDQIITLLYAAVTASAGLYFLVMDRNKHWIKQGLGLLLAIAATALIWNSFV
ncbi:MAG: sulfite exporter TauE/SafE family protein [Epsilonproteobacteria bacterium]|nr:sulfite exporter TauE/SafE family protein [Campylobacterota bacterium]